MPTIYCLLKSVKVLSYHAKKKKSRRILFNKINNLMFYLEIRKPNELFCQINTPKTTRYQSFTRSSNAKKNFMKSCNTLMTIWVDDLLKIDTHWIIQISLPNSEKSTPHNRIYSTTTEYYLPQKVDTLGVTINHWYLTMQCLKSHLIIFD